MGGGLAAAQGNRQHAGRNAIRRWTMDDPLWRYVDDWPQVPAYLRQTLDADLIPRHAVAVLRRALDFKRVIAFVGSGVSMSYGRLGWGELIQWLARTREQPGRWTVPELAPIRALAPAPGDGSKPPSATRRRMERLLDELRLDDPQGGLDLQSGSYPAAFQLLEQCARESESSGAGQHGGESRLRRCVRALLRDDAGQAYLLFERLFDDLHAHAHKGEAYDEVWAPGGTLAPSLARLESHWRTVSGAIRDRIDANPAPGSDRPVADEQAPWRSAFAVSAQGVERLGAALDHDDPIAAALCRELRAGLFPADHAGAVPAPLHRFVVTALLRLHPEQACLGLWPDEAPDPLPRRRSETIAEGRDPLLMLLRDFGLTRFATTNYDLDIERAIGDLGYDGAGPQKQPRRRSVDPGRGLSRNALGRTAHDTVFRHLHAAELLRFAAASSPAIQVVHLHGRVHSAEPLVVTEDDYQSLYLQRTDIAEAANDAIGLALRSNTVLFIGSGMNEDDILRPMRQFVAERKSSADRSGVVLLPADGSRGREMREVFALYGRYGVLTKHFGLGDAADGRPVRWLAAWLALHGHLKEILDGLSGLLGAPEPPAAACAGLWRRLEAGAAGWPGLGQAVPLTINGESLDELLPSLGLGRSFDDLVEIRLLRSAGRALARLLWSLQGRPGAPGQGELLQVLGIDGEGLAAQAAGDGAASRRLLVALRALLDGLPGALRALAMLLELASLHRSWLEWKRGRTDDPVIRPVGAQRREVQDKALAEQVRCVFTRNRLALRRKREPESATVRHEHAPEIDRFMEKAPSHSFSRFADALAHLSPSEAAGPGPGAVGPRRQFLLLARRGLGKGHFFEMMGEDERVVQFIRASWGTRDLAALGRTEPPCYAVACFVNLGVSLEFLSAFDRLSLVLVEMAEQVFEDKAVHDQIERAAEALKRNRLARLQAVLRLYAEHADEARERLLIAFNGFGQFFDWHGVPKNAQLHRLVEALIGHAAARVPIDVLLICQESDLPGRFKRLGQALPIQSNIELDRWSGIRCGSIRQLVEPNPDERLRRKLQQTAESLGLAVDEAQACTGQPVWLHLLRGAHASATVGKYFPEVALAVALDGTTRRACIGCAPAQLRDIQEGVVHQFAERERQLAVDGDKITIDQLTLSLLAGLVNKVPEGGDGTTQLPLAELVKPHRNVADWMKAELEDVKTNGLRKDEQGLRDDIDARFRRLHHGVRTNRYLLTIVCAAASERGWRLVDTADQRWVFDPSAVTQWLDRVRLDVSNHLQYDAVDRIIGQVLASHQQRHEQGALPPAWTLDGENFGRRRNDAEPARHQALCERLSGLSRPPASPAGPVDVERGLRRGLCGPAAWRLQQRLLWHLAVMSLEVQADVLATAPLVEADCRLLVAEILGVGSPADIPAERLRSLGLCRLLVDQMLDLLVHRGLVFRMEPVQLGPADVRRSDLPQAARGDGNGDEDVDATAPVDSGWRFTIHRFLQRSILEQMKAPFVEFPKVDQFGLSLWATQPDELPRPNRSAAHDIAGLVAAWIGFPKGPDALNGTSTFHWFRYQAREAVAGLEATVEARREAELWRTATLPARMLRAALGVLRATYSVGVVSRFHDFDDDASGLAEPDEGYFKQHHLQVRWLLEQAKLLKSPDKGLGRLLECVRDRAGWVDLWGPAMEAVAPFYVDELVWLNNECGLFCLVEGRLENAAGMFRQALAMAENVEGRDPHGALWCRVHLNLAIVDIERGRIREADERLKVIEGVDDENPILRILARGFRALVEHLSGNLDQAERTYEKVVADLVRLGQLRSVAIFSRHLAELQRLRGESAAVKAYQAIEQSIAAATKGGHEDIRHLAMLSRVRLAIARVLPAEVLARERASIQVDLDAIEHYGHVMGMPRLLADVAYARALYLLNLGETRHAARLAYQCLGLCGANGLRLRQMMGMALLGSIYRARGLSQLAHALLTQAYSVALDCHYGNMREVSLAASGPAPPGP